MIRFNVADINLCTEVEGPGKRMTIWFQGCTLKCLNCSNQFLQALTPNHILKLEELEEIAIKAINQYGIEGVTYLGGEPTIQLALPSLTASLKKLGLGIIAFTGRIYDDVSDILQGCDMVIDGPYIEEKRSFSRKIIGSSNQRIIHLTNRYKTREDWFMNNESIVGEFSIHGGELVFNGSTI